MSDEFIAGHLPMEFNPLEEDAAAEATPEATAKKKEEREAAVRRLAESFRRIFAGGAGDDADKVMTYLANFSFAYASVFHSDPLEMARRTGRQEVFRLIADMIKLDDDNLMNLALRTHMENRNV